MTYASSVVSSARTSPVEWPPLKLYLRETGRQSFPVSDLVYMQAVANYSWLNWMDGRRMLMPRTLKYYMPKLPTEWFIRLHRNCVVNRRYVERLERTDTGGLVHLTTGDVLPVSRRRWSSVRRQLVNNMPHLN
ncbi:MULTISPECIES: LytR/AlgR family response regulator transcription factor [Spirosoma]|uniref:Response regulator receiver protein n=2 Tax=Spirosoma TaxID=107 RepID=A0A6G9ANR7_9BACT|nr:MULTISPECIES: LytTR family transcriptional regulator DNA-binding domain-containing protein [Spirosoma]QHV94764.1 response regulator receiver protein [Spirosoma endbachense]QIP13989.1 response regulator receiver protein [Spirosoma aureum]